MADIFEMVDTLVKNIEKITKENEALKKQIAEFDQDATIKNLSEQVKHLRQQLLERNEFVLSPIELEEIEKWKRNNDLHDAGAIGGSFTYSFIPTSIGTIGTVEHSSGKTLCFRDL